MYLQFLSVLDQSIMTVIQLQVTTQLGNIVTKTFITTKDFYSFTPKTMYSCLRVDPHFLRLIKAIDYES